MWEYFRFESIKEKPFPVTHLEANSWRQFSRQKMIRIAGDAANASADRSIHSRAIPATAAKYLPEKVLCSVYESQRGDSLVSLCFIKLSTGDIKVTHVLDSQTFVRTIHKIHLHEPTEIVVPQPRLSPVPSKLVTILKSNITQRVSIIGLDKRFFDKSRGEEELSNLAFDRDVQYLKNSFRSQEGILCAFSAAVHQLQHSMTRSVSFKKFRIKFEASESVMFIDSSTARSLELVTSQNGGKGMTLLKFMKKTVTKMGERSLRNSILQPLSDVESITERFSAVLELTRKESLLDGLKSDLMQCEDLDKLFTLMLVSRNQISIVGKLGINHLILVKSSIQLANNIGNMLETVDSTLLQQVRDICNDEGLQQIMDLINDSVNEDVIWAKGSLDLRNQMLYAVKSGSNGLIGVSRNVYKMLVDEVYESIKATGKEFGVDVEQGYNAKRGFYIKLKNQKDLDHIPPVFIKKANRKNHVECTTLDLLKLNSRIDDTVNEIITISDQVVTSVIEEISRFLPILFMVAEALSLLDLIQSFAQIAVKNGYKCPEFSENIMLRGSRHPILESLIKDFVPNDVICLNEASRFQVITGTNMSGKSVYLRQVALISIMAQIGCFVPADCAILKVFHSLKARVCADIPDGSNISLFSNEMMEMACILEEIDERSLVLIDELGRGSSISDGYAISLAICEHLIKTKAIIFVSTHFHKLSYNLGLRIGVAQVHMSTVNEGEIIKMRHQLKDGISDSTEYGTKIAQKFFEGQVILRSREISNQLKVNDFGKYIANDADRIRAKKCVNLAVLLRYLKSGEYGEVDQKLLLKIQDEFIR